MSDQEIMNYWYSYLYKNYPFIKWKIEIDHEDQRAMFHVLRFFIQGTSPVQKITYRTMLYYTLFNNDRQDALQNKTISKTIKDMVKQLKRDSSRRLKEEMAGI